jgi:hypothetical protein
VTNQFAAVLDRFVRALPLVLPIALAPGTVAAETQITGFAGVAFAGATDDSQGSYGGTLGFMGTLAGFETEFATTPDFFGRGGEGAFTENNVLTLMGSFLLATPPAPVRVYGAVGFGLLKTRLEDPDQLANLDSNDFGINAGGGLLVALGDHFSLRGDVRYFRDLQDPEFDGDFDLDLGTIDYWRAVGGITLRF